MYSPQQVPALVEQLTGLPLQKGQATPVSGGSINAVYRVDTPNGQSYCCKLNSATNFPHLFRLEKDGLQQLRAHIQVPDVLAHADNGTTQVLVLAWVEPARPTPLFWTRFGETLTRLHAVEGTAFGAAADNYMGAVPQENSPLPDWPSFFRERRLLPLARKCAAAGLLEAGDMTLLENLCTHLESLFAPIPPKLVHGDLWSGNFLCNKYQQPVLIDPAVYYGHPSVDLGMTELFGGFDPVFYEAYRHNAPFPENHQDQWTVCNLYPLLVHLFLFGSAYLAGVRRILYRYGR